MGATLAEALRALAPHCPKARVDELVDVLPGVFESFGIVTKLRQAHFLAQTCHESLGFVCFKENLNYSPSGLINTFPHIYRGKSALAFSDSHHAEQIANRVYAHKNGNGDFASGDGWKFHGRGMIQLTGRELYEEYTKASGVDAVKEPDLLEVLPGAALAAGWFWQLRHINVVADVGSVEDVTKRVNGGTNGLGERTRLTTIAKRVWHD